jgi:CRP-like cAMP-binding protein
MGMETEKLNIGAFKFVPDGVGFILTSGHSHKRPYINQTQKEFVITLSKGLSIQQLVAACLKHEIEFSFQDLYKTVFALYELNLITNPSVKKYFEEIEDGKLEMGEAPIGEENRLKKWNVQSILSFPFFRNLKSDVAEKFLLHSELLEVPERTLVIKYKTTDRYMYVLLDGTASIYRVQEQQKRRQLITTVPAGSIFGEGGFLFGHARTADVITNTPAILARITYDNKTFDPIIHSSKLESLQIHFWILHGLLSSPLFHGLPCETMDNFARTGKVLEVPKDTVLTVEGKPGDCFFVLIQGEVAILQHGREVKVLKPGDIFGEVALLMNDGIRMATAVSLRECMLLQVSKAEFFDALSQNLVLAKDIEELAQRRYKSAKSRVF